MQNDQLERIRNTIENLGTAKNSDLRHLVAVAPPIYELHTNLISAWENPSQFLLEYLLEIVEYQSLDNSYKELVVNTCHQLTPKKVSTIVALLIKNILVAAPAKLSHLGSETYRLSSILQKNREIIKNTPQLRQWILENVSVQTIPPPEPVDRFSRRRSTTVSRGAGLDISFGKRGGKTGRVAERAKPSPTIAKLPQTVQEKPSGALPQTVQERPLELDGKAVQHKTDIVETALKETEVIKDEPTFDLDRTIETRKDETRKEEEVLLGAAYHRPVEAQRQYQEALPTAKKSANVFRWLLFPLLLPFYLIAGIISTIGSAINLIKKAFQKIIEFFTNWRSDLVQKAQKMGIREFELLLSEDAGRPGPTERIIAQSVILLKILQKTIGLRVVIIIHGIDNFLQLFTGYIHGIYYTWKTMRAAQRRIARQKYGQAQSIAEDFYKARIQCARLLGFSHEFTDLEPKFMLQIVIELRGQLDDMKRDLNFVNASEIVKTAKKTFADFLFSFIPNPLEFFALWKDLFILTFIMKYSRREVQEMYIHFVQAYLNTVQNLEKEEIQTQIISHPLAADHTKMLTFEEEMLTFLQSEQPIFTISSGIEENRRRLQRIVQLLLNPKKFVDPKYWSPLELLREVTLYKNNPEPLYTIEWNQWLLNEVNKALQRKQFQITPQEQQLRDTEKRCVEQQCYWQNYRRDRLL